MPVVDTTPWPAPLAGGSASLDNLRELDNTANRAEVP
jgi:hypothetical protein